MKKFTKIVSLLNIIWKIIENMFDISGADNGEQTGAFCRHRQRGGGDLFPASGEVADPISGSGGEIGGSDGAGFAPGGEDVGHEG